MNSIISRIKMKRTDCAFVDRVNGREVFKWIDHKGRTFLAHTRWGFRTKTSEQ